MDGTLVRNDLTHELVAATGLRTPLDLPRAIRLGMKDKPAMKRFMLERHGDAVSAENLPYQDRVVDLARAHKARGGRVYLCSGSHEDVVKRVVEYNDWLDGGWGTRDGFNLTSSNKADFLSEEFPGGFDYVGNSTQDYEVWKAARKGYAINPPRGVGGIRTATGAPVKVLERPSGTLKAILKAMRVHQWAKNGLMFLVPLLTFAELSLQDVVSVGFGFVAFSLLASSTYVLNDLVDIDSDRKHATKRDRMLASGRISIPRAVVLMGALGGLAVLIAAFLPPSFWPVMGLYLAVTLVYSFRLKRVAIADVLTLSGLFSLRVFAGATLVLQPVSPWLLNFIAVFFLNLALVKRYTELRKKPAAELGAEAEAIAGRGYVKSDETLVLALGVAMASLALLSFFLYGLLAPNRVIESGFAIGALAAILLYWMMRVWLLAHRGRMDDDPVLFAIRDKLSLGLGALVAVLVFTGHMF